MRRSPLLSLFSPHGGAASTPFLCISYAKRVFDISEWGEPERMGDRWTHGRSRSQWVQLVSAACFEMKNHREMRRDESRHAAPFHSIIINVAVGREGQRGEEGERRPSQKASARHVAALPRARFVSNGAGEIDFLRSLLRRCSPITCKDLDFPGWL